MMKKILLTCFLIATGLNANAEDKMISKYVDELINKSFAILKDSSKSLDKKVVESEALIAENMDLEWMAKFVLGKYRRSLLPEQVQEFTKQYSIYVVKSYSSGVKNFKNQQIKVKSQQALNKEEYVVKTSLLRQDLDPLQIDYLVRVTASSQMKIFDVVTEGISLINSHQAEFGNILSTKSFPDLIRQLKNKIRGLESGDYDSNGK